MCICWRDFCSESPAKFLFEMKPLARYLLLALTALAALACTKTPFQQITGSYTYKTGGTLLLEAVDNPDTRITLPVRSTYGRMDIASVGEGNEVIVTLNALLGDAQVWHGRVSGEVLSLFPREFIYTGGIAGGAVTVGSLEIPYSGIDLEGTLTVSASGRLYDGRTMVLDFTCTGPVTVNGKEYRARGLDMVCSATKN